MTKSETSTWALALKTYTTKNKHRPPLISYLSHPAIYTVAALLKRRGVCDKEKSAFIHAANVLRLIAREGELFCIIGYGDAAQLRLVADNEPREIEAATLRLLADFCDYKTPDCKLTRKAWQVIRAHGVPEYLELKEYELETDQQKELMDLSINNAEMNNLLNKPDLRATGFPLVALGELEITEPDFLIDEIMEVSALALMFGDPGCGKSFAALDVASSVAAGMPFHGRDVKQGPVIYLAGEGKSGLVKRFAAWCQHNGITDRQAVPLYISERPANFLDDDTNRALGNACDAVAQYCGTPALIVVDTVARSFGGGDENSTMDMGGFICAVDDLKARYPDAVILLVHHTGHADKSRARGSIALKGALDAEYRVEKQDAAITITCTKMKDAPEPAPIAFDLKGVKLGIDRKGREFGSAVLVETEFTGKTKTLSKAELFAMETYRAAFAKHGIKEDGGIRGLHKDHWRDEFISAHRADKASTKRSAFSRALAMDHLFLMQNDIYLLRGEI
jgi:hypothetical protein